VSRPSVDLGSETYDALGPIAYLTGEYPRATDTFIQREIAALRSFGVDVRTFSVRRTDTAHHVGPEQRAEAVQTFYVQPASLRPHVLLKAHAWAFLRSPLRYLKSIILAVRSGAPGVRGLIYQVFYFAEAGVLADELQGAGIGHLHNHFGNSSCSVAMLASVISGIPYSYTMHGPAIFFEPARWSLGEKIKRAKFVACISHFCRSQAMIFCPPQKWDRLHIIHCGVDPTLFKPVEHQGKGKRLLTVGRMASVKGMPVLLEAIKRLQADHPELKLTVVGDGPERKDFEQRAEALGIAERVDFVGYQSQSAVREKLSETDVFVLPSFAEGVPVVLMEAMAAGVPPVTTRIAGVAELIDDGTSGQLVPPGDGKSLASAIDELLRDPDKRNAFGKAGHEKVATDFNITKESDWLRRVMTSALEGRIETTRPE